MFRLYQIDVQKLGPKLMPIMVSHRTKLVEARQSNADLAEMIDDEITLVDEVMVAPSMEIITNYNP